MDKIIKLKAQSLVEFHEVIGKPITFEEAYEQEKARLTKALEREKNEVFIDITTGKEVEVNF